MLFDKSMVIEEKKNERSTAVYTIESAADSSGCALVKTPIKEQEAFVFTF